MERRMNARFSIIGAAILLIGAAASADPAETPPQGGAKPANSPARVVLASADQVRAPAPAGDQVTPAPVKHRAARVTTCRCGDQAAGDQPEQ